MTKKEFGLFSVCVMFGLLAIRCSPMMNNIALPSSSSSSNSPPPVRVTKSTEPILKPILSAPQVKPMEVIPDPIKMDPVKKKVLMMNVVNRSYYGGERLSKAISLDLEQKLSSNPETVVIPEEMANDSKNMRGQNSEINLKNTFEYARSIGAAGVAIATIEDVSVEEKGDEVGVFKSRESTIKATTRLQLYDVSSEKLIFNKLSSTINKTESTRFLATSEPEAIDAAKVRNTVNSSIDPLIGSFHQSTPRLSWSGQIAKIDLHRHYINAGESSGIQRGDLLKVFTQTSPIINPSSNVVLGQTPGHYKGTLRIIEYLGDDATVAVVHSGGGFKENDRVEIYSPQR